VTLTSKELEEWEELWVVYNSNGSSKRIDKGLNKIIKYILYLESRIEDLEK